MGWSFAEPMCWVGGSVAEPMNKALEIVTCHWGGLVSKEDVTISKQTFRVVLNSLRRPSGSGSFAPPPTCLRILRLPPGEG